MRRRLAGVFAFGLIVAACSSMSEEALAEIAAPLIEAHEALEDFDFKISAGMSRGDFIEDWPDVASKVARGIRDYYDDLPDSVPEDDLADLNDYAKTIASTGDSFTEASAATRDFIYEDGDESDIRLSMFAASLGILVLDERKTAALTPGPEPDPEEEDDS